MAGGDPRENLCTEGVCSPVDYRIIPSSLRSLDAFIERSSEQEKRISGHSGDPDWTGVHLSLLIGPDVEICLWRPQAERAPDVSRPGYIDAFHSASEKDRRYAILSLLYF